MAAIPQTIIGADLLSYFGLIVDLKNRRLVDVKTNSGIIGELKKHRLLPELVESILTTHIGNYY